MDKILRLYTYIDGVNDTPFPSSENHAVLTSFQYDSKRMGGAPTISATLMHEQCLDRLWTYNVYAQFNGEKYFIKNIPSSQYSNNDVLYKHELVLVSERVILDNVYFYDVVSSNAENDKPVSNSTKFTFFGDIHEFAKRLNYSLQYRKVGYSVVVDEGISSEGKMVSFEDAVFSNAIQESYNTYEIPYYFVGKVIHFGFTSNAITETFRYGADESLLSIQKSNANTKVITRITGTGSSDNIPYYYPNDSEQGSLTLLYNGEETSNVIVKDRLKFTNLLLENKLLYTYKASAQTTLTNRLTVSSYTDITQNADTRKMYYFNVEGKFTVEKSSDITLSLQIGNNSSTILRIENAVGTEQLYRQISGDSTTIYTKLSAGVFTIYLYVTARLRDDDVIEDLSGAQTYIERSIHLSVKSKSEEQKYWSLNDKVVFLSDYGLELSSGFTPSNGDYISIRQDEYIQPSDKLLPPIYRETKGAERFYEAKNNTYINPQTGAYYHFNNEFAEGNPKEHIVSFDNIKPTIKGMTNALGYRIDMFQEFAYDLNDNDDTYPEGSEKAGEYIHPYFFAKLRKFDGDYGFNLFDHAIDEGEMTISMTSGNCGACEWIIGVDENTNKNIVQVDSDGNLYRDEQGNVLLGAPQDRQNDTQNYEVWIALKKDINTFGVIMPNATYNYKPSVNDTFVILHIDLPKAYVLAAENRLKEELIKYMATNNDEKFNFSVSFSRIYFAENPNVLAKLNENARLQIEYDGTTYELYVSSYSYKMSNNSPLPEIQVELSDTLAVSQNALQTAINKVEQDIMRNVGSIDWLKLGLAYFLRKDVDDRSKGAIASDKQLEVGRYVSGVSGAIIYVDKETGQTIGELDKLYVRMKAYFEQLEIVNVNSVGGKQIISPAGAIRCNSVITQTDWDYYRCYFLSEQDGVKIENRFKVGDQAYSSMFNAREGIENSITNHYYCRLVVGIGEDYIDLSKSDCDTGSDIPKEGDVIVHRGNRNDIDRQNFIEFSSVDSFSPSITLYQGVNSYSVADKEVVQFGVNKTTGKAFMNVYGDMYIGNRDGSAYISYTPEEGLKIKGTLDIGTNFGDKTLKETIDAAGNVYKEDLSLLQSTINNDINNLQSQIDGAIETWFFNPIPTLTNAPAKDWTTDEQKNTHLGDLYYNAEGRAYRFQFNADTNVYYWNEIVDTDIKKALENAKKAQDTADGKRRVFIEQPKSGQAYDIGDIWVNATYPTDGSKYKNDMLRAKTSNDGSVAFDISHWTLASKYTDDTIANQALSDAKKANDSVSDLSKGVQEFKLNVEGAFRDGIIDESETQALDANMKQIGALKDQVEKSYADIATNSLLAGSTELTTLGTAKTTFLTACQELLDEVAAAISDKVISDTERIRVNAKYDTFNTKYGDYNKALNACIRYVEEKLNESISTYSYLKEALKQETTIAGGLVQTTSLVLGYKGSDGAYNVMAGSNGLVTSKGNKTPAFWMGGDMIDLFDVYNSSTGEFDREAGVRYAQGMDRMDGTGYRANGNLWWDAEGRVHADPLSFFVGENTVGALLASFQVVLKADGIHPDYLIPKVPFQSLHIADTLRIGEALVKYDATNKAVYVTHPDGSTDTIGFYAEGWVSAKGANGSSSGGGGGASALYQLVDVLANSTNDGVQGATTNSVLMYNGTKWQAGNVVTNISPLTLNVNGSSLFTYDGKSSITANLTVPTKVSQLTNDSGYLTSLPSHTHSYAGSSSAGGPALSLLTNGNSQGGDSCYDENTGLHFYKYNGDNNTIGGGDGFILQWSWGVGNVGQQLYLDDNPSGIIGIRGRNTDGTFTAWAKILTSSNWSSYCAPASHTHDYLPLSGGTMTGTIDCSPLASSSSAIKFRDSSPYASGIAYDTAGNESLFLWAKNSITSLRWNAGIDFSTFSGGSMMNITPDFEISKATGTATGYIGGNTILHAGNYNSYAPTLSGTGASGDWDINIKKGLYYGHLGLITTDEVLNNFIEGYIFKVGLVNGAPSLTTTFPNNINGIVLSGGWDNNNKYGFQLMIDDDPNYFMALRQRDGNNTWNTWKRIPMGDGTGASGTWGISITGNAATATDADTVDNYHASGLAKFYLSPMETGAPASSAISWFTNSMPSGAGAIVYNVPGSEKTIIVGKSTGLYGHMLMIGYDDNYLRLLRFQNNKWLTDDWEKISAGYADNAGNAGNADTLDGLHESSFSRHIQGKTSSAGPQYYKIGTLPPSSNTTYDAFVIQGQIGGWPSKDKVVLNICISRRDGTIYTGYVYNLNGFCDIGVNTAGEVVLIVKYIYCAWTLDLHTIQGTISYTGSAFTPSDTNFTLLSASTTITKSSYDGTVEKTTKLQTPRTIWGQSFDGTANIETTSDLIVNTIRDANLTWCFASDGAGNISIGSSSVNHIISMSTLGANNGFYMLNNGNVGIGTTSPEYKLDVNGNIRSNQVIFGYKYSNNENAAAFVWDKPGSYYTGVGSDGTTDTIRFGACDTSGVWASYTQNWKFYGNAYATGAVTAKASSSDIRLKTDITDYKALSIIRSHKSIKYHWNEVAKANADIFKDDYWHYGLIAQDVQRDMPQMVSDVFKDYLVINYERLIPICWKGLQEVDDEVTKLKKKVRKLEMEIRELKQKEDRL